MTPAQTALTRAQVRLVERMSQLEARLADGDEAVWSAYTEAAAALAAVGPAVAPGASGELLTTQQLADRLQLSPRTVRRRMKSGDLKPTRVGRAVRWPA